MKGNFFLGCAPHPSTSPSDSAGHCRASLPRTVLRTGTGALWCWGLLGILGFLLAGCRPQETLPSPSDILGPYTATGTITATGASLYRRGTHVFLMDGSPRFFLESKTIDLNQYEGVFASVEGELFPNTHPSFLPVLQVSSVTPKELPLAAHERYDVPALGLSLRAPAEWVSELRGSSLTFRRSEEKEPFLMIGRTVTAMPREGLRVRIGGKNAVRIVDDVKAEHRVYTDVAGDVLLFTFTPRSAETIAFREAFYALLRSVRFSEEGEQGSSASEDAAEGPIIPCGGPAHVLCPEGMFCEVRELDTGIGVCRKL